jgi:hypothetical protein
MSLYDELIQLQLLPDSFEEWADYRLAITGYLIEHTTQGSSIAIFGAGRCHDMDLRLMADHFSSITLLDENVPSMQNALHTYGLSAHPSIHLSHCNFTGITSDDYRTFSDELSTIYSTNRATCDIHTLAEYAIDKLDLLYEKAALQLVDFGQNCFDYSATFGVHSQLNNMAAWIFSVFAANLNQIDSSVDSRIMGANHRLIPRFNDAILKATTSAAFFGCELKNASIAGSIQGAIQCIDDLTKRGIMIEQAVTYWPFDVKQNKLYQMLIQKTDCSCVV